MRPDYIYRTSHSSGALIDSLCVKLNEWNKYELHIIDVLMQGRYLPGKNNIWYCSDRTMPKRTDEMYHKSLCPPEKLV